MKGQLGQNLEMTWKHFPTKIDALNRFNIISSCAGEGFSIFLSNYGVVLSCGDNSKGCLGHNNTASIMTPKVIGKTLKWFVYIADFDILLVSFEFGNRKFSN